MITYHLPDPGPLEPDAAHVVVRNLHDLLQAEHARVRRGGQLVHRYSTQPTDKIHCKRQKKKGSK